MKWFSKNWPALLFIAIMTTIMIFCIYHMAIASLRFIDTDAMKIGIPALLVASMVAIILKVAKLIRNSK